MLLKTLLYLNLFINLVGTCYGAERDYIRIVGSSSVYPFIAMAGEDFSRVKQYPAPVVEATGTGGGIKLFCASTGVKYPDIVISSREMKESEKKLCAFNNILDIEELILGHDGVIIAQNHMQKIDNLTKEELYKILAKYIIEDSKFNLNKNAQLQDINKTFPVQTLYIYGPPVGSGTRDAITEQIMTPICKKLYGQSKDKIEEKTFMKKCVLLREDEHYINLGENDSLIAQKLMNDTQSLGIISYSLFIQNNHLLRASKIEKIYPDKMSILENTYPFSRTFYVYVKKDHYEITKGLYDFVKYLSSDKMIGQDGYLTYKGLIPPS